MLEMFNGGDDLFTEVGATEISKSRTIQHTEHGLVNIHKKPNSISQRTRQISFVECLFRQQMPLLTWTQEERDKA